MSLLLAWLAQATQTSSHPDIVVEGRRIMARDQADRMVDAVMPRVAPDQPFARFTDPVCPGAVGLSTGSARAILDRIGDVAADLKLRVGAAGCKPNILLIVVPDGRAFVRRLVNRGSGSLAGQSLADVRRIVAEPGTARAWTEAEVRSRDGERASGDPGEVPTLAVSTVGRIASGIRRDAVSAVVVIDKAAISGREPGQVGDYVAMRALAAAVPAERAGSGTILSAFTPGGDAAAPTALTAFDRGLLRGLYFGAGNRPSTMQRGTIVSSILTATAAPGAGEP